MPIDPNAMSICNALKTYNPILRIGAIERQLGTNAEVISTIQDRVIGVCNKHAALITQALEFNEQNQNWGTSYFANHIAGLIADRWITDRTEALQDDYAEYLSGLARPEIYSGLPSSWAGSNAECSYVATVINAISTANSAYLKFNLFHFDSAKMHLFFEENILNVSRKCLEQTIQVIPESGSNPDSVSSILQSYIKSAGMMMHDIWTSESAVFINAYKNASPLAQQEFKKAGGNIELIKDNFVIAMNSLLNTAIHGLEVRQDLRSEMSL